MITINGKLVDIIKFPAGEVNPIIPEGIKSESLTIQASLQSSDDVMALLLLLDAIERNLGDVEIDLVIPYMPYGRQDRMCNKNEAVGVKVFLSLIPSRVRTITTFDSHNPAPCVYFDFKFIDVPLLSIFNTVLNAKEVILEDLVLVAPDAGSSKKVKALSDYFEIPYIQGIKVRDTKTGKLSGFSVDTFDVVCEGKKLLIVDDICDGGGTFIGLSEVLSPLNPETTDLFVTHGIFSKGYEELFKHFGKIITTDTFEKEHDSRVSVVEVLPELIKEIENVKI